MHDKNFKQDFDNEKKQAIELGLPALKKVFPRSAIKNVTAKALQVKGVDFQVDETANVDAKYLAYNNGGCAQVELYYKTAGGMQCPSWGLRPNATNYYMFVFIPTNTAYIYSATEIRKWAHNNKDTRKKFWNKGHTTCFINFAFDEIKCFAKTEIDCSKWPTKQTIYTKEQLLANN